MTWFCDDCEFKTNDEDLALKHSRKKHPVSHRLTLK